MISDDKDDIDSLLTYNLMKTNRAVTRWMNNKIKTDSEYSITQLYLLWITKMNPNESIASISKKLSMDRTTYLRTIDKMKDLIKLNKKGSGRCKNPVITEKGDALIKELIPKLIQLDKVFRKEMIDLVPSLNYLNNRLVYLT